MVFTEKSDFFAGYQCVLIFLGKVVTMPYRFTLIACLLCLTLACRHNQPISSPQTIDSVPRFLEIANDDSVAVPVRLQYTKKAERLLAGRPNDSLTREYWCKVAGRYYNVKMYPEYKMYTEKWIGLCKEAKDTLGLARGYEYLGDYFVMTNQPDSAFALNNKREKIYRELKDFNGIFQALLLRARFQHDFGDFLGCEKTAFQMLTILKTYNNVELQYQANNLLGIVYAELQEYKLSKQYYEKALEISARVSQNRQFKAVTLNNLGFMYLTNSQYIIARKVFAQGLREKNLFSNDANTYAMLIDNLAYTNFKGSRLADFIFL